MMGGGLLWAFDIGSLEQFRRRVRDRRGVDGKWREQSGVEEDDEEFEKWVASLTGRKVEEGKEERKWSARGSDKEWATESDYAVIEPQATSGRGKPR